MITTPSFTSAPTVHPGRFVVLNAGCGRAHPERLHLHESFRSAEWRELRVDVDPEVHPDVVASITNLTMVQSASVDAVWSSHNLEHLLAHEVPQALREFHRVLKPTGFVLLVVPDLHKVAELVVADRLEEVAYMSPAGPISALDMLYGYGPQIASGRTSMAHRTGFDGRRLQTVLLDAGFASVQLNASGFDLWALAEKTPRTDH